MALSPDQQEAVDAYALAAWIACDPSTTTPGEVADFANEAIIELTNNIREGRYFVALLTNAMLSSIHRAMVVRGMYLDAVDTFARYNVIAQSVGSDPLNGSTYTEYVEEILAWYDEATK
jgi:hypothetical protein